MRIGRAGPTRLYAFSHPDPMAPHSIASEAQKESVPSGSTKSRQREASLERAPTITRAVARERDPIRLPSRRYTVGDRPAAGVDAKDYVSAGKRVLEERSAITF